jgi:RES domain-containing protein
MRQLVWRIATDTSDYASTDLSGLGAEMVGGRWNRKGTPLIYTSTSIALACLETLVHLAGGMPRPFNRYLVRFTLPEEAWKSRIVFDPATNVGWDALPAGLVSLDWGTRWAKSGASLLAQVPSIVVPEEGNVLINPEHPDAASINAKKMRRWTYDGRLV